MKTKKKISLLDRWFSWKNNSNYNKFRNLFFCAYALLEVTFKKKEARDERDDMINSKSYKLGYLLYEFSLFIFIGYVYSKFQNKELLNLTGNQELYNSFQLTDGGIVFFILVLLAFTSIIKSLYQFYLYRTV